MLSEESVLRFLRSAPTPTMPAHVRARLHDVIADEVELRRASRVEPELDQPDLKTRSRLWSDETVTDL